MQKKKVGESASPPKQQAHLYNKKDEVAIQACKSNEDASLPAGVASAVVIKPLTSDMLKKLDQIEEETEQLV